MRASRPLDELWGGFEEARSTCDWRVPVAIDVPNRTHIGALLMINMLIEL